MTPTNQNGFSLVESIVSLPVLISALVCVFAGIYLFIAQAWLKDAAEEAALCVAEKQLASQCKTELEQKTQTALPIGRYSKLSIEKLSNGVLVKYSYQALQLSLENEISLTLPVTKRAIGI